MKTRGFIMMMAGLGLGLVATGCGPSNTEHDAWDQARIEAEEKSRGEAVANKAITEMNKKLGRKPLLLDLGLPPAKTAEAVSPAKPKP